MNLPILPPVMNLLAVAALVVAPVVGAAAQNHADSVQPTPATPRRAGAADLDAWSRREAGEAGTFTNPDTSDWLPFRPDPAFVDQPSVFDASHFLSAPSGRHGFARPSPDGRLVFADGTVARLIGGQTNVFPERSYADWHVRWMRRHGLNLVRGHGFGLPDAERWDRLDYFISRCKEAGVYLILTPVYWTEFEVEDPAGEMTKTSSHVILFFDEKVEAAVRDLWRQFYHHHNPYTGLRYSDDPTILGFELKNEDSAFWALEWVKRDAPRYWAKMLRQYSDFLKGKYGDTAGLREAWTDGGTRSSTLQDNETLEAANIDILGMAGWVDHRTDDVPEGRQRRSDQTMFLHQKQRAFYERSYRFLREELGCGQAICGSNWKGHGYTLRHVLECDAQMDYTDQHDYWDHPQGGWQTDAAVFHNRSMLRSPTGGLVGNLAPRQIVGRPYILSEWNIGAWNEHVQEASFAVASVGLLQGWDGILQFVLQPEATFRGAPAFDNRFFNVADNPAVTLQYPTLSRMWHRQDIREAPPAYIRRIGPHNLHEPGPLRTRYIPMAFQGTPRPMEPTDDEYGYHLPVVGRVGNEFVSAPRPHLENPDIPRHLDAAGKVARSLTGELTWDWGRGYILVDTPKTQAVCGYIGGLAIETRDLSLAIDTTYGTVLVTSLEDDRDIAKGPRLLVTALGRSRNTGTRLGRPVEQDQQRQAQHAHAIRIPPEERVAVLEVGQPPLISEPVRGTLTLRAANPAAVTAHILDDTGRRTGRTVTPLTTLPDALVLPLPGGVGARFFEVERKP